MNPDGGAVPQTFKIASPDDKKSPSEPVAGEPATVALPKMGENPIPPKAVASSKISSRILGLWVHLPQCKAGCIVALEMSLSYTYLVLAIRSWSPLIEET
jgi:hypothetical protein